MQPLLIHHHLSKTAGTSLARVLRANFPGEAFVEVRMQQILADFREANPDVRHEQALEAYRDWLLRWWRDWYRSLDERSRGRLRCVRSHTAQLLIPSVDDRRVMPFTILREPVDRVISLYDASFTSRERWSRMGRSQRVPALQLVVRTIEENRWTLADIYTELGDDGAPPDLRLAFAQFFNGQATRILYPDIEAGALPLIGSPEDLEDHRRRAFDALSTYVVGTQDRLSESVRLFADSFGLRRAFVPQLNVGSQRTRIDEKTRSLIRAHNSIDADLHAHYSARLEGRPGIGRIEDARARAGLKVRGTAARAGRAARRTNARIAGR